MNGRSNNKLASARQNRKLTQDDLARIIGVSADTIHHWEKGVSIPSRRYQERLSKIFNMTEEELGFTLDEYERKKNETETRAANSVIITQQAEELVETVETPPLRALPRNLRSSLSYTGITHLITSPIVSHAIITWIALAIEIILPAILFAILRFIGESNNISVLISFIAALLLIFIGLVITHRMQVNSPA